MDYEKYYENIEEDKKPEHKRGHVVLAIALTAVVFLIAGVLLAGLIQSIQQPWQPPSTEGPKITQRPKPETSAPPEPTPLPTQRPMANLDGIAPVLPREGNPIPDIVDAVAPSVVGVLNYASYSESGGIEQGMGSGFIISSDGYILTNAHVVEEAGALAVTLLDGTELEAELIGVDRISDVAVLRIDSANLRPLKLGDSANSRVGDYVVAVGNPLGRGLEGTVTMGIISARSRTITIDDHSNTYIQTDAAINVGNSGGPLLNMYGEVIGINTAKTINAGFDAYGAVISAEGLGFALPINDVRLIIEHLITKGFVERAALGVQVAPVTKAELDKLGLKNGLIIVSVVRKGPADIAGLLPGDIIIACDSILILEQKELVEYVSSQPIGASITLTVRREEETLDIVVELVNMESLDYKDSESME